MGDVAYCQEKKKELPEHLAKSTNHCPFYDFNSIDAYGENEKGYQPRHKKCIDNMTGQMSIIDFLENIT